MNIKILPADKWFSLCVRKSAGWTCQASKKQFHDRPGALHCAHIFSRRHRATRWHPDNVIALSFGEHKKFDEDHEYKREFSVGQVGEIQYNWLNAQRRRTDIKFTKAEIKQIGKFYKDYYEQMSEGDPVPICPIVEEKLK